MRQFFTEADRLEAFSDGVIAVIITIMVLELKPPAGTDLKSLQTILPTFAAYLMSFIFVGIYWNNHHHMLRATNGIDGRVMWANLHLLFWLSLAPFTPYAFGLLLNALAYILLQSALAAVNGPGTPFAKAIEADVKGKASLVLYVSAIVLAFVVPLISDVLFVAVAIMWFVPDRRFEPVITARR